MWSLTEQVSAWLFSCGGEFLNGPPVGCTVLARSKTLHRVVLRASQCVRRNTSFTTSFTEACEIATPHLISPRNAAATCSGEIGTCAAVRCRFPAEDRRETLRSLSWNRLPCP